MKMLHLHHLNHKHGLNPVIISLSLYSNTNYIRPNIFGRIKTALGPLVFPKFSHTNHEKLDTAVITPAFSGIDSFVRSFVRSFIRSHMISPHPYLPAEK